uniref:threonine--tRNA ligase n=1 Tax=Tetranychus urticae TaxID=32264 RepID=T1KXC7_TETUR
MTVSSVVASESATQQIKTPLKELSPSPEFIEHRLKLWDKFKSIYLAELATKEPKLIKISCIDKDGNLKTLEGLESWKTTPIDVAKKVGSKSWVESIIISKVNGKLWDLERPLEEDCSIELIKFDDDTGKAVFWHSTAHVLGEALERLYGSHLCYGPPIENGFYYDMYMIHKSSTVSLHHFPQIENLMKTICNEKQPFERLELTKEQLLEMFNYNQFKVRILNEKVKEDRTTVYRCGSLIDLCLGPHIKHTGLIKALKVTKSSATHWEGDVSREQLQRVYGISFPDTKQMKEWERFQEEAAKRDHRKIGVAQDLFFFHEFSRGSAFFTPYGAYIYNNLIEFIRKEYRMRGFKEVISPNIYNTKLWETSGHWQHYKDNMFVFDLDEEKYALKPMNCPGHCLIFDSRTRSWKDLPIKFADFGVLHRNEVSGALSGLTRVRRFQQDDAHIFCSYSQIEKEILECLQFMQDVYSTLGFTFDMVLSTRPDSYIGELSIWNNAEESLKNALNASGNKWGLNPGDGAFYGPKIDITVKDALKRPFQCATIQLDFQLPIRFNLSYIGPDGEKHKPVIIHRAIFGSVERFIAILTENFAGKWPFWLSPKQAILIPVAEPFVEYAESVRSKLYLAGFEAEIEADPGLSLNKKVRNAQLDKFNFILVVGEKEKENDSVNVRTRDNVVRGEFKVDDLIEKFKRFKEQRLLKAEDEF